MRFNPSTESQARTVDALAAESRRAIQNGDATRSSLRARLEHLLRQSTQDRATTACGTWKLCQDVWGPYSRAKFYELNGYLIKDLHEAMYHRPHQSEF